MQTALQIIMGHYGPFTRFYSPTNKQFDKCKKETLKFHHSTGVYQKSHSHGLQLLINDAHIITDPTFALSTLFGPKNQNFGKIKKITGDIITLQQCTKNRFHMIFNSQNITWIALQTILGHLCLLPNFWPKKSNFLKNEKKRLEILSFYIGV